MPVVSRSFRLAIVFLTLLLAITPALANSGTLLIHAGLFHLVIGNFLIGMFEAFLISRFFAIDYGRFKLWLVIANYVSLVIGGFVLFWLNTPLGFLILGDAPLYRLPYFMAAMYGAAFILTVLIEWPFVHAAFRLERKAVLAETEPIDGDGPLPVPEIEPHYSLGRTFRATLLAQVVSYLLMTAFFWWPSGTGLLTNTLPTRSLEFSKHPKAWIYYQAPESRQTYRVRLDGSEPERSREELSALIARHNSSLTSDDQYLQQVGAVVWRIRDLRPAENREWKVLADYWGTWGVYAQNEHTRESVSSGLEVPFITWRARCPTVLPGDQVVYQLGNEYSKNPNLMQIVLFDLHTREIALVARGRHPVVVLEGE